MLLVSAAQTVIATALGFLVTLGVVGLFAPARAFQFWRQLGSTPKANLIEACLRGLVGAALFLDADSFPRPDWAQIAGGFLVVSAVVMGFSFRLHHWYASRVVPPLERLMRPYSAAALGLVAAVVWFWRPGFDIPW